jgi:hypothetical protein
MAVAVYSEYHTNPIYLLLPLGAQGIRETLRFTSVS